MIKIGIIFEGLGNPPLVDFSSFPPEIWQTLKDEYLNNFSLNFDWNAKQDEFSDSPEGFRKWLSKNESLAFTENLDTIILQVTQDMITLKKRDIADKKLSAFEELIIPTLGNDVLTKALSKYEEQVLMNPNATVEMLERGFAEAKNIIDADGSIDSSKVTQSSLFVGGEINVPAFESFVVKNPEYKGVYGDWKKIFDESMGLSMKDLHSYRGSTSIERMRELRTFLMGYKKNNT